MAWACSRMRLLDLRAYGVGVSPDLPDLHVRNPSDLWVARWRTMVTSTSGVLQLSRAGGRLTVWNRGKIARAQHTGG